MFDVVFFYQQVSPTPLKPFCATMNISEIWSFDGTLIATDINSASVVNKVVSPAKKIFYVWDLEWMRPYHQQNYLYNLSIFRSPYLKLVARSEDHVKLIEHYCNRKVDNVIQNFQLDNFLKV
jgi:hypothetical protein